MTSKGRIRNNGEKDVGTCCPTEEAGVQETVNYLWPEVCGKG